MGSTACSGPCAGGYLCPAGSTVATARPCPPGTVSVMGGQQCGRLGANPPQFSPSLATAALSPGTRVMVAFVSGCDEHQGLYGICEWV
jgi:hypothetical protein